ncbi:MAG: diacylglycerol kinase family protein [Acidimicrobiia bacterium]
MTKIAVVAHARKVLGDGLPALRAEFEQYGFEPVWHEVQKSKQAPKRMKQAIAGGADIVFVWGGDGTVQRCIDVAAGNPDVTIAILPAGTANLLATNLGIPLDLAEAVRIGLRGERRALDVGKVNGEHFAVMAGCGFDALMIRDADRGLKDRFGRAAYVWTGAKNLRAASTRAIVDVDGEQWFAGKMSCLLVGNVGSVFGGLDLFEDARPDDGRLDVGVVTAKGFLQWGRAMARVASGPADRSPFVRTTVARKVKIELERKVAYELDGGDRPPTKTIKIKVRPHAITVAVPAATA